jgi:peptidoglycan/LPS O-acetylase OafA/YrhL
MLEVWDGLPVWARWTLAWVIFPVMIALAIGTTILFAFISEYFHAWELLKSVPCVQGFLLGILFVIVPHRLMPKAKNTITALLILTGCVYLVFGATSDINFNTAHGAGFPYDSLMMSVVFVATSIILFIVINRKESDKKRGIVRVWPRSES